jgi:hypothetical protein
VILPVGRAIHGFGSRESFALDCSWVKQSPA